MILGEGTQKKNILKVTCIPIYSSCPNEKKKIRNGVQVSTKNQGIFLEKWPLRAFWPPHPNPPKEGFIVKTYFK